MSKVGNYDPTAQPPQYTQPPPQQYPQPQQPQQFQQQPNMGFQQPIGYGQANLLNQQMAYAQANVLLNQQMGIGLSNLIPNQPTLPVVWMKPPPSLPNYAPGLEFLAQLDQIIIKQEVTTANILTGRTMIASGGKNRYTICNSAGEQIYIAAENPTVDMSSHNGRQFIIQLYDSANREVMRVIREHAPCGITCCISCCKNCAVEIKVEAPPGKLIGYIRQAASCCVVKLGVLDAEEKMHLYLKPPAAFQTTGNVEFSLLTADKDEKIGSVIKFFGGALQEYLTKADNFGIYVPANLELNMKAILLASVFLIDFLYFESTPMAYRSHHHHGHHGHHGHRGRRGHR